MDSARRVAAQECMGRPRVGVRRLRFIVGTVALALVLAIALGVTGVVSNAKAFGAATTLTIISGDVNVRHGAVGAFALATDGEILNEGDGVRTGTDGRAVLTHFEGSTVTIEPATELTIENSSTLADGGTVVVMTQSVGRTWHVVTRLITGSSKYEVRTPASTASVRGTAFTVDTDGDTTT
ncbi:MAG: FecR domain-containing protein, partial [Candidatus Limnocylindria bacterium]|nr:FecR domain-containing protein [Candidatus Limnocylindria bacterium]